MSLLASIGCVFNPIVVFIARQCMPGSREVCGASGYRTNDLSCWQHFKTVCVVIVAFTEVNLTYRINLQAFSNRLKNIAPHERVRRYNKFSGKIINALWI